MKIRITQKTTYRDAYLMPGDCLEVDDEQAAIWIADDCAIQFDEAVNEEPKPKARQSKKGGE